MDIMNGGNFSGRLVVEMDNEIVSPIHDLTVTIDCGLTPIASLEMEPFTRAYHNRLYTFSFSITFADVANGIPLELFRRALAREEFALTFRPADSALDNSGYATKYNILRRCAISRVTMGNMSDNNDVMTLSFEGDSLEFGFDNFKTDGRGGLIEN